MRGSIPDFYDDVPIETRQRVIDLRFGKKYRGVEAIAKEVGIGVRKVEAIIADGMRAIEQTEGRCSECGVYGDLPCRVCAARNLVRQRKLSQQIFGDILHA